ncbi:helix-turn-helix domain-containing protein [Promicromonospora sp. NFX87]|jgi:hypothetical protein|uniref:helix-turn-helix domain-containing protein n=1 Tax=Promicromonospora sp. NFX87 TaxID=3402691 RepID=UPI003AFB2EE9
MSAVLLGAHRRPLAAMRAAREDGATWEQIGRALRITKQSAQDFYKRWETDPDALDREPTDGEHWSPDRRDRLPNIRACMDAPRPPM